MDNLGKLVSLLTAIVGLVSALVGYKVLIAKQKAAHSSPTYVVRFKNPAVRTRPWNLKLLRWLNLFPASINLLVVLLLFAEFGYLEPVMNF